MKSKDKMPQRLQRLCERLAVRDEARQVAAAKELGELGDPRAIDPLIAALEQIDFGLFAAATRALAQLCANGQADRATQQKVFDTLVAKLDAGFYPNEESAAAALGILGDVRAIEPLRRKLSGARGIGAAAATSLGQLGDVRALDALIEAFRYDHPTAVAAAGALVTLRPLFDTAMTKRAREALLKAWHCPNNDVRAAVGAALGKFGGRSRTVAKLVLALNDSDEKVGVQGARSLAQLGNNGAIEPLIESLGKTAAAVRKEAALALASLGQPQWQQWFKGEPDDYHRLARSGVPQSYDLLEAALRSRASLWVDWAGYEDRAAAALAIGELGDERAIHPLRRLLFEDVPRLRVKAAIALSELGVVKWQQWIHGDEHDYTRMGESGDPEVRPLLESALQSNGEAERVAAAKALGKLGLPAAIPALRQLVKDAAGSCPAAVAAAAGAFALLAPEADPALAETAVSGLLDCLAHRQHRVRKPAARGLVAIAQHRRSLLQNLSDEIKTQLRANHIDEPSGAHCDGPRSDCYGKHDDYAIHRDQGIGLSFDDADLDF